MDKTDVEFTRTGLEVAVIGMSGRYPEAPDLDCFWENLIQGKESVVFSTPDEKTMATVSAQLGSDAKIIYARGAALEDAYSFDAAFFDYVPSEVEAMDPQVRIFHECAWEAMEHAGYAPDGYTGVAGVYAGSSMAFKFQFAVAFSPVIEQLGEFTSAVLSNRDFMASRVSYKLGLKGPSFTMNTACSTGLVAVDLACRGILTGQCTLAIAGAVGLHQAGDVGYLYQEGMIGSDDGHCRAFDARAKGTVSGEGIGVVVLKLLEDALEDGDTIHAVIKGSAVNNDGSRKVGFTAPSVSGQAEVIRLAHHMAEIEPETIGYVETHGTATPLGDPVEIEALKQGFNTEKKGYCPIGSVKTNIGHLDSGAGMVGFLKTVMILKHRMIPASLHFISANPVIDFEDSPFYVNHTLKTWERGNYPLRAGVSSFGIGGTNAHIVLEEAPPLPGGSIERPSRQYQLLLFSARTPAALDMLCKRFAAYFQKFPEMSLADAAYTLHTGRKAMEYRHIIVSHSLEDAAGQLNTPVSSPAFLEKNEEAVPLVFMFPGIGAQYVNMGKDLYLNESVFREEVDRCFGIFETLTGHPLKSVLYPAEGEDSQSAAAAIVESDIAQPLLFVIEYALARLLIHWGLTPAAVIGYSFGEYTAACIAGVLKLKDALALIVQRGKLLCAIPPGVMLSVPLAADELEPLMPEDGSLSLAIDNGPSCIVAGEESAVSSFETAMKQRRLITMRLSLTHAMHSHMMEPVLKDLERMVATFSLTPPEIPMISNVTGDWLKAGDAGDPAYWSRHLRGTVRFARGVKELLKDSRSVFVEVGPGRDLSTLLTRHLEQAGRSSAQNMPQRVINMVRPQAKHVSDTWYVLNKLGALWASGAAIDWQGFYREEKRRRIPLPVYPFQRQHFRVFADPQRVARSLGMTMSANAMTVPLQDYRCYIPNWKRSLNPPVDESNENQSLNWLVFSDNRGIGEALMARLRASNQHLTPVVAAGDFSGDDQKGYRIDPGNSEDYRRLFKELTDSGRAPHRILHLWSLDEDNTLERQPDQKSFNRIQIKGCYSLLYIVQAANANLPLRLEVVTRNLLDVTGEEDIRPEHSTLRGLLTVIPQEISNFRCRLLDIKANDVDCVESAIYVDQIIDEIMPVSHTVEPEVAFRGGYRWLPDFQFLEPVEQTTAGLPLKKGGVYLITGGLGEIGMILAQYLAETYNARLILTGRSPVPPRDQWQGKLKELLETGGQSGTGIYAAQCDAADLEGMRQLLEQSEQRLGPVNGVIHCAGNVDVNSFKLLKDTTAEDVEAHFRAKVHGTLVLAELFKDRDIDLVWLMSSVSTVLGGYRFGQYASANAFLDSFADYMRHRSSCRWLAVAWDGMPAAQTTECFASLLSRQRLKRAVVSFQHDLHERIRRWVKLEELDEPEAPQKDSPSNAKPRPALMNPYTAPETDMQHVLADTWQNIFGFSQIGIDDDFFELGGDSLKAIVMINKLHPQLGVLIPLEQVFKTPTIRSLSFELEAGTVSSTAFSSIQPAEAREYYPVTPLQRRIYVLNNMEGDKTPYNMPVMFRVKGDLEPARFQSVFQRLVNRHESLRTSFHMIHSLVVQKIEERLEFAMSQPEGDQPEKLIASFIRPFDLGQAPLLRVALVELGSADHLLMFDMHHIISDGTSMGVLIREFMSLYSGSPLEPPVLQYKDFALWLHSGAGKAVLKEQENFWLEIFKDTPPVLNLFTDFPRPEIMSFEGRAASLTLPEELVSALRALAKACGATLYMVLLAAFNVMLYRYTGQTDIVVGTTVAGRSHDAFQAIIGMFINTLPMRNFPQPGMSFQSFLAKVKDTTLSAYENQAYPFGDLVEQLGLDNDISRNPLYDVELILQNTGMEPLVIEGLEFTPLGYEANSTQVDISIYAEEVGDFLLLNVNYCSRLYKQETIERMLEFYRSILETVSASPGIALADIDVPQTLDNADASVFAPEDSEFDF